MSRAAIRPPPGHRDVEQADVGLMLLGESSGLVGRRAFGHDVYVGHVGQ